MRRSAVAAIAIVVLLVAVVVALVVVRRLGGISLSDYFFSITAATFTLVGAETMPPSHVSLWMRQPGIS